MSDQGLRMGTPAIESVGPIAFGPDDVLFVADNVSANIFAIDVADDGDTGSVDAFDLDDIDTKLASHLGCNVDDVIIRDLAVHPRTHNVYLSVMRGRGNAGHPADRQDRPSQRHRVHRRARRRPVLAGRDHERAERRRRTHRHAVRRSAGR